MIKKLLPLVSVPFLVLFLCLLAVPEFVTAQSLVPCEGVECSFCDVVSLGSSVVNWFFGIVFVIFGVITLMAGFGLLTSGGNQTKLDDAKNKLSNAVIGIIIVFSAWLIVDTLMKALLPSGESGETEIGVGGIGPWNQISCEVGTQSGGSLQD